DPGPRPEAELAETVAQPMAIERDRRPGEDAVDDDVVGIGRHEGGVGDDRDLGRRVAAADPRGRGRPQPAVEADLDELDPAVEDIGQRGGDPAAGTPRIIGSATDLVEEAAKGLSRRVSGSRGGCQEDLPAAVAAGRLNT